jgi:hypothetical protein
LPPQHKAWTSQQYNPEPGVGQTPDNHEAEPKDRNQGDTDGGPMSCGAGDGERRGAGAALPAPLPVNGRCCSARWACTHRVVRLSGSRTGFGARVCLPEHRGIR